MKKILKSLLFIFLLVIMTCFAVFSVACNQTTPPDDEKPGDEQPLPPDEDPSDTTTPSEPEVPGSNSNPDVNLPWVPVS